MIKMSGYKAWLLAGLISLLPFATLATTKPLLQEGKQTLYQRILTYPNCTIGSSIGEKGTVQPAFSRFYVYERQTHHNEEWLKVGPDTFGNISGWMPAQCTAPWKMQLTLAINNPANRNPNGDRPLLFFKDRSTLEAILNDDEPESIYQPFVQDIQAGRVNAEVLAQEPPFFIDQKSQFYLLPVLESEETFTEAGYRVRLLNVASVSEPNETQDRSEAAQERMLKVFSASIVFVIDTTISMDPYIERTKEAINDVYKKVEDAGLLDHVKFGLIAYRSNIKAVPGLEYDAKMYVNPNTVKDGADFLERVKDLKQAKVSSPYFDEDPYAGLMMAIDDVDWTQFGARYIVLITDAGAITANDPLSSTKLDAEQVRQEAERRGVAIYTVHIKMPTPSGKKNHASAQAQYETLTFNNFLKKPLYYPVNTKSVKDVSHFGKVIESLANALTAQIQQAYMGENTVGSAINAEDNYGEEDLNLIAQDAKNLGDAMRLAYLGERLGASAPPVFTAWISDRDLIQQNRPTTEVQILLTKSELSDLSDVMTQIVNAANEGMIAPDMLFENLRSLAATMGNDPSQIKQSDATKLGELGLLGEYIENLPYLSDVLSLDETTWKSWSSLDQEKFIRRLNTKLNYYQRYNEDVDRWRPLAENSDPRDYVYPVPLENLP